jgi:early endosome antigen 1
LLERCLAAESELERMRTTTVEMRRKLDDSQAALHELGRENQAIQVGRFGIALLISRQTCLV